MSGSEMSSDQVINKDADEHRDLPRRLNYEHVEKMIENLVDMGDITCRIEREINRLLDRYKSDTVTNTHDKILEEWKTELKTHFDFLYDQSDDYFKSVYKKIEDRFFSDQLTVEV